MDALGEVGRVRNGPEEVGLDQCDVIELRGAGCASLSAAWAHENLRHTHKQANRQTNTHTDAHTEKGETRGEGVVVVGVMLDFWGHIHKAR